jgi:hypothetical protein
MERPMDVRLVVSDPAVDSERIAGFTRELLKDVRAETDPKAELVKGPAAADTKGDIITLGQIALALISGGAITTLIQAVFGFLGRHKNLEVELENGAGSKLKLKWEYLNANGEAKATELVETFLKQSK